MLNYYVNYFIMTNRKAFTVDTNISLSELFTKQALERGFTKYRAIEGAIRCWLALFHVKR